FPSVPLRVSPLSPYPTLFRSGSGFCGRTLGRLVYLFQDGFLDGLGDKAAVPFHDLGDPVPAAGNGIGDPVNEGAAEQPLEEARGDRKSTRLNSSHVSISYAVF